MLKLIKKWLGINVKSVSSAIPAIELDKVPAHVAIIMDGNGRWAKQRGLPRVAGHHSGMKNVKKITMAANDIGVKVLNDVCFFNGKLEKTEGRS